MSSTTKELALEICTLDVFLFLSEPDAHLNCLQHYKYNYRYISKQEGANGGLSFLYQSALLLEYFSGPCKSE